MGDSRSAVIGLLIFMAIGCLAGCGSSEPTNTGYTGSWSHGNQWVESTIYIWHDGEKYRFRWSSIAKDGGSEVICDWDGRCEEWLEGEKASEYNFKIWEDENTGFLMVRCEGEVYRPESLIVEYTDELVLTEDGLGLWSYTNYSKGVTYEGDHRPKRLLAKLSDTVPEPPRSD